MNKTKCRAGAFVGLLLAGAAAPLSAQTAAPERRVDIGVSLDALYDDNIAHSSRELAELRGLDREDVRFTPAITIDALLPVGRNSLTVIGSAGYDFYARNSRLNRERLSLDGIFDARFGRCDTSFSAGYRRRQSEIGDLIAIAPDGALAPGRVENVEDIKSLGASAICGGTVGLKPTASISYVRADNSANIRTISDYESVSASGGIAYARPSFGLFTIFGGFTETSFPNRPLLFGGDDGFRSGFAGGRFERQIGSRLTGLAELSYTRVEPERPGVEEFDGATWRLNLTADVSSRLQLAADVSRSIQASNRVDANYYVEKLYALNGSYALSGRVTFVAGASQRERDFEGSGLFLGPVLTEDRLRTYSAGARFRGSRRLTFALDAVRETRNANGDFYDYTSNRIGLSVAKTF